MGKKTSSPLQITGASYELMLTTIFKSELKCVAGRALHPSKRVSNPP